jgi:hypothetical protein
MGHGTPDWGAASPKETTYALGDMAELAARLGSIDTFERGGEVIFLSDFGDGLAAVETIATGTGGEVYPIVGQGLTKPISLILKTGNGEHDLAGIYKYFHYPVLGGVGTEISFRPASGLQELIAFVWLYDGAHFIDGEVRYNHEDGTIQVWKADATWVTIGTPGVQAEDLALYCTLKFTLDTVSGKYARVLFNSYRYPAGDYSPPVTPDLSDPQMSARVYAITGEEASVEVQIANFIVTQNERV